MGLDWIWESSAIYLFLAGIAFLPYALYRLVKAIKGKRLNDHPVCRNCHYDLSGLPKASPCCPECGHDITEPGHVQINRRLREPQRIWTGIGMLVLALALLIPSTVMLLDGYRWLNYTPTWFLRLQTNNDTQLNWIAWLHLYSRCKSHKLTANQMSTVIDDALILQRDLDRRWTPQAGTLLELTRSIGSLSDADWLTYRKTAMEQSTRLVVRSPVAHGQRIAYKLTYGEDIRLAGQQLWLQKGICRIYLDDQLLEEFNPQFDGKIGYNNRQARRSWLKYTPELWSQIPEGKHRLRFEQEIIVTDADRYGTANTNIDKAMQTTDSTGKIAVDGCISFLMTKKFDLTLEVQSADAQVVTPLDRPDREAWIRSSMVVRQIDFSPKSGYVSVDMLITKWTLPLAHDVYLRVNDREYRIGQVVTNKQRILEDDGHRPHIFEQVRTLKHATLDKADIIFKPSRTAAIESLDLQEYWAGELVYKDVPIVVK